MSIFGSDRKSRSLTHVARRNVSSSSDQASSSRSGGVVYDEAYLSQLKASTPSTRPPRPADDSSYDADVAMAIDAGAMIEGGAEELQPFGE